MEPGRWRDDLDSKTRLQVYINKAGIGEERYTGTYICVSAQVSVPN